MANEKTATREPLFHISKRDELAGWKKAIIYVVSVVAALILGSIICTFASTKGDPVKFFSSLVTGVFMSSRSIWETLRDVAYLICVSMALLPAFKMKFWNLGNVSASTRLPSRQLRRLSKTPDKSI